MVSFEELVAKHQSSLLRLEMKEDNLKLNLRHRLADLESRRDGILDLYRENEISTSNSEALHYIDNLWEETEESYRNSLSEIRLERENELRNFKRELYLFENENGGN